MARRSPQKCIKCAYRGALPHTRSHNARHVVCSSSNQLARYWVSARRLRLSLDVTLIVPPRALSANRGIGFELVKQLLDTPSNLVVATCRNPDKATALSDLKTSAKGTLRIIRLDVADFVNVRASAKEVETILGDIGLDYLVNNAGIVRTIHDGAALLRGAK